MKFYTYDCIVIGTGAAGYNAACRLHQFGKSVAMVSENINYGTSRNTGSDKQTYYKIGLGGDTSDSVWKMATDLFNGGSVDGDNALCEAALSARCFLNLCEAGVEFPTNRYGEFVGYKTDHDPYERATSAGPLTSKFMTEALEKKAQALGIKIFDGQYAAEIILKDGRACGLLCLDENDEYVGFICGDIVMATGGPAGIYADSVYPECHSGSTGLALKAGAKAQNLAMWQYGLASVNPRWNVSGTYMQVLPRLVSIDENGNEYEFLSDYFEDKYEALSTVFLKGYQWPFDVKKAENGSSKIDMTVYNECVKKHRKVYLDFTKNPFGLDKINFEKLSADAYDYLKKAEATFGTPIERLEKMNAPAIELYKSKGVDITKEYLEIALCAQHNNGGIAVDLWWQTSVKNLFAVGECAGTHGISRPGGSALNAGQVGSLRAAQFISQNGGEILSEAEFEKLISDYICADTKIDVTEKIKNAQRKMSDCAAAVRDKNEIKKLLAETKKELENFQKSADKNAYKYYDILITQAAVLTAMLDEKYQPKEIQETYLIDSEFVNETRAVRPLPNDDNFFENVWRAYRENKNIY